MNEMPSLFRYWQSRNSVLSGKSTWFVDWHFRVTSLTRNKCLFNTFTMSCLSSKLVKVECINKKIEIGLRSISWSVCLLFRSIFNLSIPFFSNDEGITFVISIPAVRKFSALWCLINVDWHLRRPQLELRGILRFFILTSTCYAWQSMSFGAVLGKARKRELQHLHWAVSRKV